MRQYSEAAQRAAAAAESQAGIIDCLNPGNILLLCFLEEVRNERIEHAQLAEDAGASDHVLKNIKVALRNLREHPLRVHDVASAMEVKGIGASIAQLIKKELFALYPPDPPTEEERGCEIAAKAAIRAEQAGKRRRQAAVLGEPGPSQRRRSNISGARPATLFDPTITAAPALEIRQRATAAMRVTAALPDASGGAIGGTTNARRADRAPKEYVPAIGTANFAFMVVLLQALRGPERLEFLSKHDLIARAEASGLSDKPIQGEGNPGQAAMGRAASRAFYSGWSSFKTLISKGLAYEYSNPKKVGLTPSGLMLAERLYREAVMRGRATPIQGIPAEGPFMFQVEAPNTEQQDRAMSTSVQAPLPSAALRPAMAPSAARPSSYTRPELRNERAGGGHQAGVGNRKVKSTPPEEEPRPLGASGPPKAEFDVPLAERLMSRGTRGTAPHEATQRQQQSRRTLFVDLAASSSSSSDDDEDEDEDEDGEDDGPPFSGNGTQPSEFLQDGTNDARLHRDAVRPVLDNRQSAPHEEPPSRRQNGFEDEDLARMMEMGFSDRRARKALRRSGALLQALDIVDMVNSEPSDSESEHGGGDSAATISAPTRNGARGRQADGRAVARTCDLPEIADRQEGLQQQLPGPTFTFAAPPPQAMQSQPLPPPQQQQLGDSRGHIRGGSQPMMARPRAANGSQSISIPSLSGMQIGGEDRSVDADPRQDVYGEASHVDTASLDAMPPPSWQLDAAMFRLPPLTPGKTFGEEYQVVLLVDGREQYTRQVTTMGASSSEAADSRSAALQAHLQCMRAAGVPVEHRHLPAGDALWIARRRSGGGPEFVLDMILERKSLPDLVASIKTSSRYITQKYLLKRCGVRYVYYLIEGDVESWPTQQEYKMMRTAAATTEIVDGFKVLRTKGVPETFRLYQSLTQAIAAVLRGMKMPNQSRAESGRGEAPMTFESFQSSCRDVTQGATTLHDVWGCMLCEIPGLGAESVRAVLQKYPTPVSLFKAYKTCLSSGEGGISAAEKLLVGLRASETGRALGPDGSRRVFRSLFENRWAARHRGN